MRRFRVLLFILIYAGLGAGGVFVFGTQAGLHWIWGEVQAFLPSSLQVQKIQGRLIGPLTLDGVDYKTASIHVHLNHMHMQWSPLHLLSGTLDINQLHIKGLHITSTAGPQPGKAPPAGGPYAIHLPLFIHLKDMRMSDFSYRSSPQAKPFVIHRLQLTAGYDIHGVYFNNLLMKSPLIDIRGGASLARSSGHSARGGFEWKVRPPGYPAVVGHTRISGNLKDLEIRQHIQAPYALHARVEIRDPFTRLRWQLHADIADVALARIRKGLPISKLSGHVAGNGGLASADLQLHLHAQSRSRGAAALNAALGWHHKTLGIKKLVLSQPGHAARISAGGSVQMGGRAPRADIHAQWQKLRWPLTGEARITSPAGQAHFKGTPDDLLARFQARLGDKGRVQGEARIKKPLVKAHLAWQDLRYPLQNPRVLSKKGQLDVDGTLSGYRLKLASALDMPGEASGFVHVAGQGDSNSFKLSDLDVKVLGGRIRGSGRVAWKPSLQGRISLKGTDLNPGALQPNWPGKVNFAMQAEAAGSMQQPRIRVSSLQAGGRLRGHKLSVHGALRYGPSGLDLDHLTARLGDNRMTADGHAGQRLNLTWHVDASKLAQVLPRVAGSLQGAGQVQGRLHRPALQAQLKGKSLSYGDNSLKSLSLDADIDPSGRTRSQASLQLTGLHAQGHALQSLALNVHGTPASHQISLQAKAPQATVSVALHGALDRNFSQWKFRIVSSHFNPDGYSDWTLTVPASGLISARQQSLQQTCWSSGQASLCLSGMRRRGNVQAAFKLQRLPIAYFAALLPATLKTEGRVSGQGKLAMQHGRIDAQAHLDTTAGQVATVGGGKKKPVLKFDPSHLDLTLTPKKAQTALDLNLDGGGTVQAHAHMGSGGNLMRRPLQGTVRIAMNDLSFLPVFVPQASSVSGQLQGKMNLGGTLASPSLNGQLALNNGQVALVLPGITLKQLMLTLNASGHAVHFKASAQSGGGSLNLQGQADLAGKTRASVQVQGQKFEAVNVPAARVYVSPDLKLSLQGREVHVSGKIDVPKADITPKNIPSSGAVTVSPDQEIVRSGQQSKRSLPLAIYTQVRLVLGNKVEFEGFGLKTHIQGNILTDSQPGKLTTAGGQLDLVNGHYKAYGQNLDIQTGKLLFSGGPVDNPGVEVRAVRPNLPSVTVGVHVTGSIKDPNLSLFSEPPMSQEQQLSWLVLGRPLSRTSSTENSALSQAALALGLKGGNFLTKHFGSKLGLDTFTLQSGPAVQNPSEVHTLQPPPGYRNQETTTTSQQASLLLGKYLTPRLFVSYGFGLFDRVSTLQLRYTLSKHWSISSESSTRGYGGDINYTIER